MSSVDAGGQDAFNFLSNITFGTPASAGKTPKKPKQPSSRSTVSFKPTNGTRPSKSSSQELSESRPRNSRSSISHTDDSPVKTATTSSSKHAESSQSVSKSKSASLSKEHHRDVRPQPSAALDFLSGISLGGVFASDSQEPTRPGRRDSTSRSRDTNSFELTGSTPIKSGSHPISPRMVKSQGSYDNYHENVAMEDAGGHAAHEEELGVHETTNLLFASHEESVPVKEPISMTTVIPSKSFTTSAKKTVKNILDGQRTMWACPPNQARLGPYLMSYQPSLAPSSHAHVPLSRHVMGRPGIGGLGVTGSSGIGSGPGDARSLQQHAYGAILVSSIIFLENESSSAGNHLGGGSPGSGTDKSDVDSNPSDSPREAGGIGVGSGSGSGAHGANNHTGGSGGSGSAGGAHIMSSRFGKHAMKFLHPKKKSNSVSYQHYLTPSPQSVVLNAAILAQLPTFSLPREMLISSGDIFRTVDDTLTPDSTPSTPRSQKNRHNISAYHHQDSGEEAASSPTKHHAGIFTLTTPPPGSRSPPQTRQTPRTAKSRENIFDIASSPTKRSLASATSETESNVESTSDKIHKKSKGHRSKHSDENQKDDISSKPKSRSNSVSADASTSQVSPYYLMPEVTPVSNSVVAPGNDGLPQSPLNSNTSAPSTTNVMHGMDPYERCLLSYAADFLDNDIERPGKYLIKSHLPGYTSSLMPVQSSKLVRQEENEAFKNRHHWLTTDIKLSKIRSVKRKLEQVAIAQLVDIACTALSYVYFEKLILRNLVSNHNARLFGSVCFFLAAKFYGIKMTSFSPLLKELESKLKVAPKEILANEFFIYRKLRFALFVEPDEVMPHFLRLRASPAYLDREFAVQQKERKRNQKKHAAQSHTTSSAANEASSSLQSRVSQQFQGRA